MAVREEDLDLIADLPILEVAFDETVVNVDIGGTLWEQSLQQDVSWYQELLLLVDEFESAVTIAEVVKCDGLGKHVITHAAHLHGVRGEEFSTVDEAATLKGHWVVALVHNEHPNDPFITVDDEVAAELVHVLLLLDELSLGHATQVAILGGHHDGDLANANVNFLWNFIVDSSAQSRV